ncbi:hypothetical protein RhiJN_23845 [Ceratobasidium sp. AG-Ba]|nr:hypothetical protein RhiJN_23845 [Ceratobasidium sp. AG-Ba]
MTTDSLASSQVFSVPELVALISGFLQSRDLVHILCTSKTTFIAVVPRVWEALPGIRHLLSIIGGAVLNPNGTIDGNEAIDLTPSLTTKQPFSGFHVYSRFVKELILYGPNDQYIGILGWGALIDHNRVSPLLPNLRRLNTQASSGHGSDLPLWIDAIGSPRLTHIWGDSFWTCKMPIVSYPIASSALESIVTKCPNIERLSLFPDQSTGEVNMNEEGSLSILVSSEPFYNHLLQLPKLQTLVGSTAWLRKDALGIIAQMPELRSLTIHGLDGERIQIMEEWFTGMPLFQLEELGLKRLHPHDIARLLTIDSLVLGLNSLELTFDARLINAGFDDDEWFHQHMILPLQPLKYLYEFSVDADVTCESYLILELGSTSLDVFSRLPLETVFLNNIDIDNNCLMDLGRAWPKVTDLQMPTQRVGLATLTCFASLPVLQELELLLDMKPEAIPTADGIHPVPSLRILKASNLYSSENRIAMGSVDLVHFAQALHKLWPNLREIFWPKQSSSPTDTPEDIANRDRVGFLNGHLAALRKPHAEGVVHLSWPMPTIFEFCDHDDSI